MKNFDRSRAIKTLSCASAAALTAALAFPTAAQAQAEPVVGLCSGVSLPPSVVTGILGPVVEGTVDPLQAAINGLIGPAPLPGLPGPLPLDIDVAGLLANAAAGEPVTLQVIDSDGNLVAPTDACNASADSFALDAEGGIAIGGNRISGLGANGNGAVAADIDAIAFGNGATAAPGATASIAIGSGAGVTAPNSVALGAGSTADRGPQAGYAALGLDGPQDSAGEFSVGAPGAARQITNVAPGTAVSDAATVGQVQGVADDLAALDALAVQYDDASLASIALGGADGTTIGNVADGAVTADSTEAVNGSQLFDTNQAVAGNTAAIAGLDGRVTANSDAIDGLDGRVTANTGAIAGLDGRVTATEGAVAANTGAIDGLDDRVTATEGALASNMDAIDGLDGRVTATEGAVADNGAAITDLDGRVTFNSAEIADLQDRVGDIGPQAVEYVSDGDPTLPSPVRTNSTRLAGATDGPVRLGNVAEAVRSTDAVNLGQLQRGLDSSLSEAKLYTDTRFAELDFDLGELREDLSAGTAGALAVAGLPQAFTPGKAMISMGVGHYRGESAVALGASSTFGEGDGVVRVGASLDTRGYAGVNGGIGIQF